MSNYKPYPTYKDSGIEWIGEVPEHWEVKPLKIVASHNDDSLPESLSPNTSIHYVDISAVSHDEGISCTQPMAFGEAPSRARRKAKSGDVVVSTVRTYLKAVASVDDAHADCVYSTGFAILRSRNGQLAPGFLKWLALNDLFIQAVESHSEGLSYPAINASDLVNLKAAIPGISEQMQITEILSRETARIDALIAKKNCFIGLLEEKRLALINHAVTKGFDSQVKMKDSGIEWIGEVPEHWKVGRLRDFCSSISTGPFGTALGAEDYTEDGVPVINPSHLQNGICVPDSKVSVSEQTAERLKFWALNTGDIIAARRGELGRAAVIRDKESGWICGTGSLRLTPYTQRIVPEYVYMVLQSVYGRSWLEMQSVGSTMPNLSESLIGQLPIVVPPSVEAQKVTLERLDRFYNRLSPLIRKTQSSIDLLKEHRAALITAAVTGKIDLRESA